MWLNEHERPSLTSNQMNENSLLCLTSSSLCSWFTDHLWRLTKPKETYAWVEVWNQWCLENVADPWIRTCLYTTAPAVKRKPVKHTAAVCPLLAFRTTSHVCNRKNINTLLIIFSPVTRQQLLNFFYFLQNMQHKLFSHFSLLFFFSYLLDDAVKTFKLICMFFHSAVVSPSSLCPWFLFLFLQLSSSVILSMTSSCWLLVTWRQGGCVVRAERCDFRHLNIRSSAQETERKVLLFIPEHVYFNASIFLMWINFPRLAQKEKSKQPTLCLHQRVEEATLSPTSPSAHHTSVSIATRRTTLRRTSCGCRASPAATCTPSPPSLWTLSPGRTSPPPSSRGSSWSSGRSWGRGSLERWAAKACRKVLESLWIWEKITSKYFFKALKGSEEGSADVQNLTLILLQVHLCEAEGLPEFLGEGSPLPDRDGHSVLVAVKQLRADATSQARYLFAAITSFTPIPRWFPAWRSLLACNINLRGHYLH